MVDEPRRWVILDVGETIIDETRVWATWADVLGVPHLTFFAAIGAVLRDGGDYGDVLARFAGPSWPDRAAEVQAAYRRHSA